MSKTKSEINVDIELEEAKVTAYGIVPCGAVREECLVDCVGGGAFMSTVD